VVFRGMKTSLVKRMRWVCSSLICLSCIKTGGFFAADLVRGQWGKDQQEREAFSVVESGK